MADYTTRVTRGDLFSIFLRAGLAFGGGLGILAVLEEELVNKRRAVTTDEFLTIYGIGRIVPSGTMTALAVAYGYKFGGLWGTVIALAALSLPVFVLTIALTIAYHYLRSSRLFDLLPICARMHRGHGLAMWTSSKKAAGFQK